jgi:predicted RNase H-like HicB family nuclease
VTHLPTTLRQVVIAPGEDGWFVAEVPSLPGCISQGRTRAEAIANIREAIALMTELFEERGEPIPEDALDRQLVVV